MPSINKKRHRILTLSVILAMSVVACGGSASPTTTLRPSPASSSTGPAPSGEGIVVLPEFIQGVIPEERLMLLVSQSDPDGGPMTVLAEAPGAEVTVEPPSISGTDVAEVTVIPEPSNEERELVITITAGEGDDAEIVTRTVTVLPWEDDRGEQAREILGLYTAWLAENRPELGITPDVDLTGTFVAPQLLVVSHYAFFNDQWELGLSWHVMLPPDDFSELYLRARSELRPSAAFRIGSWQTALEEESAEIMEVDPPSDVVR